MPKIKKKIHLKNCNHKHQQYCFKKGFIIYPVVSGNMYKVYCNRIKGNYYMKGKEFNKQGSFQAIWDLYTKIYNYEFNKVRD